MVASNEQFRPQYVRERFQCGQARENTTQSAPSCLARRLESSTKHQTDSAIAVTSTASEAVKTHTANSASFGLILAVLEAGNLVLGFA
ncbi:hypothetical protein CU102_14990 [Phyllobacterium brassicacearum]|uniref:Uncharacterized protein n=1 Tax=Phyllobacterium brassicacearum TaxID=314235 RepID=A0A2P7BP25_9HYPH|nr:hypothetical protein CU102_14990 [Phyllobacterium brassicacearum]